MNQAAEIAEKSVEKGGNVIVTLLLAFLVYIMIQGQLADFLNLARANP